MTNIKVRRYRHFDGLTDLVKLEKLVLDPAAVSTHPFYPLLYFSLSWTKYAARGIVGSAKSRKILYAARKDAAIMAYYREQLSVRYEDRLAAAGLLNSVLAYRRILKSSGSGKCNIDFAYDAFEEIRGRKECYVFAFDISDFFGNLEHAHIDHMWKKIENTPRLTLDKVKVLKRITQFSFVDMEEALVALGIKGNIVQFDGVNRIGYLKHKADISSQICFPDAFRTEIAAAGLITSWKDRGRPSKGVPQGLPISDLIANAYMLDFDRLAVRFARRIGARYYRYSDDIMFITDRNFNPKIGQVYLERALAKTAPGLKINKNKTEIGKFQTPGARMVYRKISGSSKNGFCYLGFRFDGSRVYLRDGTIASLKRSFASIANRYSYRFARSYPSKNAAELYDLLPRNRIIEEVGKVESFRCLSNDKRSWTFWTYVKRAELVFSPFGSGIARQMRRNRIVFDNQIKRSIDSAIKARANPFAGRTKKAVPAKKI